MIKGFKSRKKSPPAKGEYAGGNASGRGYLHHPFLAFLIKKSNSFPSLAGGELERRNPIRLLSNSLIILLFAIALSSCSKDSTNPYNDPSLQPPPADTTGANLTPGTFQYLHFKVFKPTCANSGCHDGTFEPDFRTVSSAYNSLVYQPVIKNDVNGTYTYRVQPYNANLSVLKNRLTVDIDGVSGIMPLIVDQTNTDWTTHKDQYVQEVIDWINNGAKDMFGNIPQPGNQMPQATGVLAYKGGTNNLLSTDPNNVIELPAGTPSIDVLFALSDDSTADANISYNKFKYVSHLNSFADSTEIDLAVIAPQTGPGFYGTQVQYTRRASFNTSAYAAGTVLFVRIYIKDTSHTYPAEIPSNGTSNDMVNFFTIRII